MIYILVANHLYHHALPNHLSHIYFRSLVSIIKIRSQITKAVQLLNTFYNTIIL